VKSFGWYENDVNIFIAMEYFCYGDLQNYLSAPISEGEVQEITFQVLEGLLFMHDNGFAHRDLKPNVSIFFKSLSLFLCFQRCLTVND
jgi:serine/threonine protein kinase